MFSQTAEYALRAVVCLAQNDRALTTHEIAGVTKVPAGYLSKVLQSLGRGGIVDSQRGIGGGFKLRKSAQQITVLDVLNVVDPLQRITTCPLGLKTHGTQLCPLHRKLDDALALIEQAFSQTTIAEVLQDPSKGTPLCDVTLSPTGPSR